MYHPIDDTSEQEKNPLLERLNKYNKHNPPPNSLVKFNDANVARISKDLYDISKTRWNLSTLGYRALFAIMQCIDRNTWYDDVYITQAAMFQYLGIQNTNQRYELMAVALDEIRIKGITVRDTTTKTWEGFGWITYWKFTEGKEFIRIDIEPKAKEYLFELKQFVPIQAKSYLGLQNEYQNWFYPLLKLRVNGVQSHFVRWEMDIEYISTALQLEKQKPRAGAKVGAYSKKNKDRISNILKNVIGIQINNEAQQENRRAKAEGREPKEIMWDYTTSREGNHNGTLYTISQETDITVHACAVKQGRSYSKVIFHIGIKEDAQSATRRTEERQRAIYAADQDMGRRKPADAGEANLANIFAAHAHAANMPAHTEEEIWALIKEMRRAGADIDPNITIAQAAAYLHLRKVGPNQYAK